MYKVVLVDDEIWALRGLEKIIAWQEYGFEICKTCRNVDEALQAIGEHHPDIVFTDIRMPQKSGMDLIEGTELEENQSLVVIVSAYRDFDVAKKAITKGVFDYLMKPLDRDAVKEVVKRAKQTLDERRSQTVEVSHIDFGKMEMRKSLEAQKIIAKAIANQNCCLCISNNEKVLEEFSKTTGKMTPILLMPYKTSFLFSGELPDLSTLENEIGISRKHNDYMEFEEMIKEATYSLNAQFLYSKKEIVASIQFFIAENYQKKLTVPEIADQFYISEAYIFELFPKYVGMTVNTFIKHVRLNISKNLLLTTDMPVREISEQVGYEDAGYFGRVFKKQFGCCPEQYRK